MKRLVGLAVMAVVVATAPSIVDAQSLFGSVEAGAYDELLPVLVRGRTFVPSFKTRIEFDDNIFTDETDPVESWKFIFEPKIDIHILRDLAYYGLSYQYSLQIYENRDPDTDESHDVSLTLNQKISERFEIRIRDRFRRMQEPELVEVTVAEGTAGERVLTRRTRNDRDYNVLSPSVIVTVTPKLSASGTYDYTWIDYEDPDVSLTGDYTMQSGSLSANYILTAKTYWTGFYRYQDIDYDVDDSKVDSTSNIVSVGATHQFSPTLSGTLQAGYEWREYADFTRETEDGGEELVTDQTQTAPYVSITLQAPLSQTISTELGYTYRIEETTEATFLSQELQSVYLGISQSFTDRLSAVFNATYDFGTHKIDEARYPDVQRDYEEQTLMFALVFRYQIKPNWHAELGWRFSDVDSDFPGQSYRRNRPFLGISAIF